MSKQSTWIPVASVLGALCLHASPLVAQEVALFADGPALEGREVIWSGRLNGLAARVERVDVEHVAVLIGEGERIVPLRGVRVGVCVDGARGSTLMLTGKHGEASEAVRIAGDEVVTRTLPALAASAPHALTSLGACHWGMALTDGTLVAIGPDDAMQQSPMLFERIADLTEVGRGLAVVGLDGDAPTFVVSRGGRTSAWRPLDGAVETVTLDALDPMLSSASATWSVDRRGALHVYTPFVGVREMAASQGAATTGLLATQLAGQEVLAWATAEGAVLTWDGQHTEMRAQWDAQIRQPLLAVDVHGDATLSVLATLENGSVGLVQSERSMPIVLGARSARAPMWVMTSPEAPACLAMTSTRGTQCFAMRELGPMGALGNGTTPVPGEVIVEGNSEPSRTHFEPLWADFLAPELPAPGAAAARPEARPEAPPQPLSASCSASSTAPRSALGASLVIVGWALRTARRRRRA